MKNTTTLLAISNLKANKTRSLLICISIWLTTMLLTVIALCGYGTIKENVANAGNRCGEHYGGFVRVEPAIYEKMKIHGEFFDVGAMQTFAEVSLEDAEGALCYMDETAKKLSHAGTYEGSFPQKVNEIAGQKGFFEHAGYQNPKVGDLVTLEYRIGDSKFVTGEFVISGFISENEASKLQKTYGAYISETFYEKSVTEEDRSYTVCFKVKGAEDLNEDEMEEKIYRLAGELGVEKQQVVINTGYLMWLLDPGLENIMICSGIALLVVLFAALVIYNIFYVGIIQKVQEYGKLRAIGTTKKQIKKLLLKEGMILAGFGVAIGLLSGLLISSFFFKWLLQRMYENLSVVGMETVSVVNIPLMLLAAAVSFVTVYLSLRKPMRIAANISPIEAMRYQEDGGKGKRKGYCSINVFRLTRSNLARNRKRNITTILTMGLSCVLFVVIANVAGNMDAEYDARNYVEKGEFHIGLDASLNDTAYLENNLNYVQRLGLLGEEWQEAALAIDGVNGIDTRQGILALREKVNEEEDELYTWVKVLSKEDYEKLDVERGKLDYDTALKNNEILFGADYWMDTYGYAIGDTVKLTFYDGEKEIPMEFTLAGSTEAKSLFVLTEEQLAAMNLMEDMTTDVWVSCEKDRTADVENALKQMTAKSDYYSLTSYEEAYKLSNTAIGLTKGALYALLGIIGVIGFMNMANTLITSMITRRREYGVLQAIGMTRKQLNLMLQLEGMVLTAGTLIVALTLGNTFGYLAFLKCKSSHVIGIHTYSIPFPELIGMTVVLLLLQMVLSGFMSRYLQKDPLIERVRYQE